MKKKVKTIGYIYSEEKLKEDEKIFRKLAKKRNLDIEMFNLLKGLSGKETEKRIKKCDIFYNNSGEEFAVEFVKTIENLGKKVVDCSKVYYYGEDKWYMFLMMKKKGIPTVRTMLLSENMNIAKKELEEFGYWPVILKRIYGTMGEFVDKAENMGEATNIMKKFWGKAKERIPIIAQEMICSPCYRVTVIDNKIKQSIVKKSKGWKCTGVYLHRVGRFSPDGKLKEIIRKLNKIFGIKVYGVDLLKKNSQWIVLEINAQPAFDFILSEREMLINEVLNLLVKS